MGPAQFLVTIRRGFPPDTEGLCECEGIRIPTWSIPTAGATVVFRLSEEGKVGDVAADPAVPEDLTNCLAREVGTWSLRNRDVEISLYPSDFQWLGPPNDGWRVGARILSAPSPLTRAMLHHALGHGVDGFDKCVASLDASAPNRIDQGADFEVGRDGSVIKVGLTDRSPWMDTCRQVPPQPAPPEFAACILRSLYGLEFGTVGVDPRVIKASFVLRFQRAWSKEPSR